MIVRRSRTATMMTASTKPQKKSNDKVVAGRLGSRVQTDFLYK